MIKSRSKRLPSRQQSLEFPNVDLRKLDSIGEVINKINRGDYNSIIILPPPKSRGKYMM